MKKVLLKIDGMTCSACSTGLEKYLNKQDGVNATVNLVMNNASIEYDDKKYSIQDLEKFVAKAGFESLGIDNFKEEERKKSKEKYMLIGITVISLLALYISMSHMVGLPVIPFLDMMKFPINYALTLLFLAVIAMFFGRDLIKNGFKNLIHNTPNMDTLVTIGVLSSFLYSLYGTVMIIKGNSIYVHNLYYESAIIVLFFIKIGKYIENINKNKTKEAIQELMTITPNNAVVEREGKQITVTIDEIKKGDVVVCKPGEKIAVDGTITEGTTHINESFITGESIPAKKEIGSKVVAGSINYEGTIKYEAEKIGRESTVSEIVRLVVEATNTKAPIAKIADKISGYFVPAVIFLALISFIIWLMTNGFANAINAFVSVLVVACPCSLGLATPLAIVVSSGVASRKGILIKNSEVLENAHKVKTIVFDKTGTLTKGILSISSICNYSKESNDDIIRIVSEIERKSEHPIAKAFAQYAKNTDNDLKVNVSDFKAIPGFGITAIANNEAYLVGNKDLMEENRIDVSYSSKDEAKLVEEGNSIIFVAKNDDLIALIGVKDVLKENVKGVIQKIKDKNIKVVMLTGDNEKTAKNMAQEIGIDEVIANVKPKEKSEKICSFKKNGLVMMCGDGINDSISLVNSDIGVSISSGTDIAMDSSSVVLMNDNLDRINDLIKISQKTVTNIKQNLFWAFFYNICMIPIAAGAFSYWNIKVNPMMAAIAMTISSLTVVFNALRLRGGK